MFANSFSALAAIPSKTASGSNAVLGDPFSDRLNTYSSVGTVTNTIDSSELTVGFDIATLSGAYIRTDYVTAKLGSDNRYHFVYSGKVGPSHAISSFFIDLTKHIPSPAGNYSIGYDFTSDFAFEVQPRIIFQTVYSYQNSISKTIETDFPNVSFFSGDFFAKIPSVSIRSSYNWVPLVCSLKVSEHLRNMGGSFAVNFSPVADKGEDTAGPTVSQQDYQSGVSDSLNNIGSGIGDINTGIGQLNQTMEYISQSQNLIIKGIDNIILHISDQLYAFWDQLYNLIHVPTMAKLDQILAAIQRMANNSDIHAVVEQIKESTDKQTGEIIANDNANTQKVEQAVEKHGNFIIEGLKGLFIPSDTFFKTWFDEQYQFFHDRLGFLMLPIDILIQFVGIFQAATTGTPGIPFPEFKWIDGTVIIPAQTVGFDFLSTDWGKDIQSKLYFVGNVIMIGALLSLIHKKLEEVLRG